MVEVSGGAPCETHKDVKALVVDLKLSVADWDEEWTNFYLNNSLNLLDLCNAFSSEISRLSQVNLILQCALQVKTDTSKFAVVHHSLSKWKNHIHAKNPRLENCTWIQESIVASLNLPKVKNSAKGKVLMRAIYGLKVKTLFISVIFTSAFSKSPEKLVELYVPETLPWAYTFTRLQLLVNGEIRFQFSNEGATTVLKELEAINARVMDLVDISQTTKIEPKVVGYTVSHLRKAAEKFPYALDHLSTEMDEFFRIVLAGRYTLLCSLRRN